MIIDSAKVVKDDEKKNDDKQTISLSESNVDDFLNAFNLNDKVKIKKH